MLNGKIDIINSSILNVASFNAPAVSEAGRLHSI